MEGGQNAAVQTRGRPGGDAGAPGAARRDSGAAMKPGDPPRALHGVGDLADRIIGWLSRQQPGAFVRYGLCVALVLVCAAIRLALPMHTIPYLLFVPAVFTVSLMFGLGAGLVATALSAILAAWLFLGEPFSLKLDLAQGITTALFVLFCSLIAVVCDAVRRGALALRRLNETLEQRVLERTQALESAHDALRQAQKMEAIGQLTGGIAHDFNNLLTAISGNLELLQVRMAQGRPEAIERHLLAAQGAATRAAALTERLLAFARGQALAPAPTDVNRLVTGLEGLIRGLAGAVIEVDVILDRSLWPTLVDPHQLENALLNLCINARDAMPAGGRLTIETANVVAPDEVAALATPGEAIGDHVSLRVGDTGVGMAPEVKARAFDPFFTTKPIGHGTGLGLSMIYGFARQSGGDARIDSGVGQGTTVTLRLPRHHGAAASIEAPAAWVPAPPAASGGTVLVIDDEAPIRALVVDLLGSQGRKALEAHDGPSGLATLRATAGIELLITDLGLPGGMNGRQVAAAARLARPGLKVLYISGHPEIAPPGSASPDAPVLAKPFTLEALTRTVQALLDAG